MEKCRVSGVKKKAGDEASNIEKSLVIIKPDGVKKKIVGEIISRLEKENFKIEKLKMAKISRELACKHCYEHKDKDFFDPLIDYITSGPSVIMVVSGENSIYRIRELMGPTDSRKAKKGTIRGDYGVDVTVNVIHGSDSPESAKREIELFFK